ncbi:MAG: putative endonuclease SmrA [Pseudomonadota bacterium]
MKAKGLDQLKLLHRQVKAAQAAALEQARLEREAQLRAERERALFVHSVGDVTPLKSDNRTRHPSPAVSARPLQRERDDQAALRESISDDFDVESLLETDEALSFRQRGIGLDVVRKLRRGHWSLQGQIDLHGMRSDDAREALSQFIQQAHKNEWRCVRVVHGKGLGSPGKSPVLKTKALRWLAQRQDVAAFVQARACDGGAGALIVLLRSSARLQRTSRHTPGVGAPEGSG